MTPDSGNAAVNWQGFLNQIVQGGIDVARLKYLGVPMQDSRVPDQADLRSRDTGQPAVTATPKWVWPAVVTAFLVLGVVAVIRMK